MTTFYRLLPILVTACGLLLAMPATAAPALDQAGAVIWPLEATGPIGRRVALETQGPLLDVLQAAGSLGQVGLGLPPNERTVDKVVQAGRSYGAALLVSGNVVVSGGRATVTLTIQDTVSGEVLDVESSSGALDHVVALTQELARRFLARWQEGTIRPRVIDLGQGGGALRLDTVPGGASLSLGGTVLGTAPLLVRGLAPGDHEIQAVLREAAAIDVLQLVSSPPGQRLQLDERSPTLAPLSVNGLSAGQHTITVLGDTPPRYLGLNVLTTPAGALVSWDGRQLGETPLTLALREGESGLGAHALTVIGRPLYGATETVTVTGTERIERALALERFAKIIVTAQPPEASVALDGKPMGQVPLSLHVRAGEHTVAVAATTFVPERRTVQVAAGELADIHVTLAPAHQGDGTVLPLPTGEVVKGLSVVPFALGFGRSDQGGPMSWVGLSTSYGWPKLGSVFGRPIGLGLGGSISRADGDGSAVWAAAGGKLQLVEQGDEFPVSVSLGVWGQGPELPQWQGYAALSRQMGDFTFHLGLGTGGLNINANYHRWPHWIVSGIAYLDYGALDAVGAGTVPMFGLRAGYHL